MTGVAGGMAQEDNDLEHEGRAWVRRALSSSSLTAMDVGFGTQGGPGVRFTLDHSRPLLREVTAIARAILPGAELVRVVMFEKKGAENWTLPWHQDRVVALKERAETPGFANWTKKAGVWHAEPPIKLLERMMFARVHLDPANAENGCLQVALGTHRRGRISTTAAENVARASTTEHCAAERGDLLFAKALMLHRSAPSRSNVRRRAIRVDYVAERLPAPLEWAT